MKKIWIAAFLFMAQKIIAQIDQNGNPVFNSIVINEETLGDGKLITSYYTLKDNVNNKKSSVYISENPSLDELLNAAATLPADFFIITRNHHPVNLILLSNYPSKKWIALTPSSNNQREFECTLKGDIGENRAKELVSAHYDSTAKIEGNKLWFNGKQLTIISNHEIRASALSLIKKQKLNAETPSQVKILSQQELKEHLLKQTKEGGELDFFTPIKGIETNGVEIKPGVFTTNLSFALYKWGHAAYDLGVNAAEDALAIFTEFRGRELNQREKDYITKGFNRALDK